MSHEPLTMVPVSSVQLQCCLATSITITILLVGVMAIGSPAGTGGWSREVNPCLGKGGKGKEAKEWEIDDDLKGVADSPSPMKMDGVDEGDDDVGNNFDGMEWWDYWWRMEREKMFDVMELRTRGIIEEMMGSILKPLCHQVKSFADELKEAKKEIAEMNDRSHAVP